MLYRISYACVAFALFVSVSPCQQISPSDSAEPSQPESKRILFIIPNYRTFPSLQNYEPLTTSEKFKIASATIPLIAALWHWRRCLVARLS